VPRKFSPLLQTQVRQRANRLCEYCHTNECWQYVRFTIDHVIPAAESGSDSLDNLALACFFCNRRKSGKQKAIDAESGDEVFIFNPRKNHWADHFIWSVDGLRILPLTKIGRATSDLLEFNRERVLLIREADVSVNRHPPEDDPRQENI
jgi:HNH endonuclease